MPINDPTDMLLADQLQADGRISNVELARRAGMAPSAVLERVRRLEERGVVSGYEARISPKELGYSLTAFILVRTLFSNGTEQGQLLADIPEVLEVHEVAGEDCFLIKVRVRDTDALAKLLKEQIQAIPGIRSTRSTIVLTTYKETLKLPIEGAAKPK